MMEPTILRDLNCSIYTYTRGIELRILRTGNTRLVAKLS